MRDHLHDIRLMLGVGFRIDRRLTASLVVRTVLTNVAGILRALWFKVLLDEIVRGDMRGAVTWALVLSVSDAFRSWALVGSQMDRQDLHDRALQHFHEEAMRLAGAAPTLEHHERQDYVDRLAVFRGAFSTLSTALGSVVDGVALAARALLTFVLLASVHPVLVVLPVFALPSLWTGRRAEKINQEGFLLAAAPSRRADHLWQLLTAAGPVKEIRVFGLTDELGQRERAAWDEVTDIQSRAKARAGFVGAGGWAIFALGYIAAVALIALEAVNGRATAGDVLLGVVLAGQVNTQVTGAVSLVGVFGQVSHAVGHYRWLIDFAERARFSAGARRPPTRLSSAITLDGVSFTYPGTEVEALHDVTLELPAGSVVALVGENGAGKTTLVKVLAALYRPTSGEILVDGVPLSDINGAEWRERVAAGFQDFARYEFLAREVVGVGDLPRVEDDGAVMAALGRAGASEVPSAMPLGLATQVGQLFGSGVDLSGGQWQKLALGRAMMRDGPLLLVLDEPTAALDAPSEQQLFERYAAGAREAGARRGAVTLLVSHRFSTVRMADLIVVLERGRVLEQGSHHELIRRRGLYAELYDLQARSYR